MIQEERLFKHRSGSLRTFRSSDITEKARFLVGKAGLYKPHFHFVENNCEHVATYFKTGAAFSQQLKCYPVLEKVMG